MPVVCYLPAAEAWLTFLPSTVCFPVEKGDLRGMHMVPRLGWLHRECLLWELKAGMWHQPLKAHHKATKKEGKEAAATPVPPHSLLWTSSGLISFPCSIPAQHQTQHPIEHPCPDCRVTWEGEVSETMGRVSL